MDPRTRDFVKIGGALVVTVALPEAFKAYWDFYAPLRLKGLLDARLKELVRLKIAALNDCAT